MEGIPSYVKMLTWTISCHCSKITSRKFSVGVNLLKSKAKNVTAHSWVQRQARDPFVKRARYESYRCRSAFKLLEINEKYKILQPGFTVVDCGAAPGSWSQVAVKCVGANNDGNEAGGQVIAVDQSYMFPLEGATVLSNSDFTELGTQNKVLELLNSNKADAVISDMAPNATGIKSMDHDLIIELCFSALYFSQIVLKPGGSFLCKIWQGHDQKRLENKLKANFEFVKVVKPEASRSDSAEVFLLARNFKIQR